MPDMKTPLYAAALTFLTAYGGSGGPLTTVGLIPGTD